MKAGSLHRLTAFTNHIDGGNTAGVWIGENLPAPREMQRIAAEVGFSETAFIAPATGLLRTVKGSVGWAESLEEYNDGHRFA